MKCKYCGYQDHTFAKVCPICGEAAEVQTVGVRTAGIKLVAGETTDTEAGENLHQTREAEELRENKEPKDEKMQAGESRCPNCGHIDTADTVFCPKCGTRIKELSYCKYCGAQGDGISRYCVNCGRDKEGKLKPKFANVQDFAEKLPGLKLSPKNEKNEAAAKKVAVCGTSVALLVMLYTNWLHIGAVSVLNSIGDFFGFSAGLKTDYSVFGFARLLWEYGGEFGDESAKIKVAAVVLMIAVGIAVICALAAIVYVFEGRIEVRDALRHSSGLIAILALALWIGSIYINDQLSQELHYSCSGIECTGWLYFSAITALFLLVKGVSIIVPETIEYADFEDSEERSDHFEMPEPVNPEDYIPKEKTTLRQYFLQDGEKKENNAEIKKKRDDRVTGNRETWR